MLDKNPSISARETIAWILDQYSLYCMSQYSVSLVFCEPGETVRQTACAGYLRRLRFWGVGKEWIRAVCHQLLQRKAAPGDNRGDAKTRTGRLSEGGHHVDTGRLLQQLQRLPHHRKGKKSRSFNVENLVFFIKEDGGKPFLTLLFCCRRFWNNHVADSFNICSRKR